MKEIILMIIAFTLVGISFSITNISKTIQPNTPVVEEPFYADKAEVKTIACYNLDGTGPLADCEVKIRCFGKEHHNADMYEIKCPMF